MTSPVGLSRRETTYISIAANASTNVAFLLVLFERHDVDSTLTKCSTSPPVYQGVHF